MGDSKALSCMASQLTVDVNEEPKMKRKMWGQRQKKLKQDLNMDTNLPINILRINVCLTLNSH